MKLFEERKALTESFEKLNRLFKEWERNPSALVRDSIKKKLIESYEHLGNLDRLDLDRDLSMPPLPTEERYVVQENNAPTETNFDPIEEVEETKEQAVKNDVEEIKEPIAPEMEMEPEIIEEKEEEIIDEVEETETVEEVVEEEEIVENIPTPEKEEIAAEIEEKEIAESKEESDNTKLAEEEIIAENIPEPEKEEIVSKPAVEEPKVTEPTNEEIVEQPLAKPVLMSSDTPFLSGDDEVELEKYFESKNGAQKEEPIAEKAEENVWERKEVKKEEKMAPLQEIITQKVFPKNEPIIEEKPRLSTFFTKEEKQKEESKQLTLADKLSFGYKEDGLHYAMQGMPIEDLTTAVPIAKKFEFIKNLFADDSENYKSAIQNINNANGLQQAMDIIENLSETFDWSQNTELSEDLVGFVKRRFQN